MAINYSFNTIFCKLHQKRSKMKSHTRQKLLQNSFSSSNLSLFPSLFSSSFSLSLSIYLSLSLTRSFVHLLIRPQASISFNHPEQYPYLCCVPVTKLGLKSAVVCNNFSCQLFAMANKICEK